MNEVTLATLRTDLVNCRKAISDMVTKLNPYRKEEKTPTMLNAMATIDDDVVKAQDAMTIAYARLTAAETEINAVEEQCKAIKKAMGSIETEMRTFGG